MDYQERMDSHRRDVPIEDLVLMADATQRLLDSGGDRNALGNLEELREAIDHVTAYQDFQAERLDRRKANRQVQTL
jgi:hypothetical protein